MNASVGINLDAQTGSAAHNLIVLNIAGANTGQYGVKTTLGSTGTGTAYVATSSKVGGGEQFVNFAHTASGTLTACTVDKTTVLSSRTHTSTSTTVSDSYNVSYIKRTNVTTGVGGTLTAAGSVLKLENVATQTAGTLTDTVDVLNLTQSATVTTGKLLT